MRPKIQHVEYSSLEKTRNGGEGGRGRTGAFS